MDTLRRTLVFLMLVLAIGSTALSAPQGKRPPMPVETAPLRLGPKTIELRAVGSIKANEAVTIRPELAGRIQGIHFEEGEKVKQGARLITLDSDEYRARLDQSTADARLAKLNFNRARDIYQKKLASKQDYDEAQAKLKAAEASQELDRVRLKKTTLRAPFSGTLGLRSVSPGDYVEAGDDIVTLVNADPVKVEFQLPGRYATGVQPGQEVKITVDAFPGEVFVGAVYAMAARLATGTRTLLIKAKIPNPDDRLRPGMFARVKTVLDRQDETLWLPEHALVPRGTRHYVFQVEGGVAHLVEIRIGQRLEGEIEVVSGLTPGSIVVTAGQMKIRDGTRVRAINRDNLPKSPDLQAQGRP